MERSEDLDTKMVRLLSPNQLCETVIDYNGDEAEYNASVTKISPGSPNSQTPSSPDFSTNTSEDEDAIHNVAGQQPQSTQRTLSPLPTKACSCGDTSLLPGVLILV